MKIYLTKYALTSGVEVIEVERSATADDMVHWKSSSGWSQYAHKGEWFADKKEANADFDRRRARKLASLHKQINKIEQLKFEVKGE